MTVTLLLGERSSKTADTGPMDDVFTPTVTARLDWCSPTWRETFVARNVWSNKKDDRDGRERVLDVLRETEPDVIVSLGITVSLLLGVPYDTEWLATTQTSVEGAGAFQVVKFPHPSGRSRFWNDESLARSAQEALQAFSIVDDETAAIPALQKMKPRDKIVVSSVEHEIAYRYYKVERSHTAACSCENFNAMGPSKTSVMAQAEWHVRRKTAKTA